MHFSLEQTEDITYRLTTRLPRASVYSEIEMRNKALEWCPMSADHEQNADIVREQILSGVGHSCYLEAMHQHGLLPAGSPRFENVVEDGEKLVFIASFETLPQISPESYQEIRISRPAVKISDEDIERKLIAIRKQSEQMPPESSGGAGDDSQLKLLDIKKYDEQALRSKTKNILQAQLDEGIRNIVAQQVLNALAEKNPFVPPEIMIQQEYDFRMGMNKQHKSANPAFQLPPTDLVRKNSTRAVTMKLISQAIIREAKAEVGPKQVREAIEQMAERHWNPDEVFRQYNDNHEMFARMLDKLMFDAAIDWVAGQTPVTEIPSSFSQIVPSDM